MHSSNTNILNSMSYNHLRVAVVGNVDAGKSTMIGTLTLSSLDDGKGSSRTKVAVHKHEAETGRTSSISTHLLGFDEDGKQIPLSLNKQNESEIASKSFRTVSLMDLAGHEKYLKTTINGVSRGFADYALVLVNASQPPTHMTMKHLILCVSCGIPVIPIITKIDSCPAHVLQNTKKCLQDALRLPEIAKRPFLIKTLNDILVVRDKMDTLAPLIATSCVTGEGLDLLRQMLFLLPKRRNHEKKIDRPFEFLVENIFQVTGVGTILSGFVNSGKWKKGDTVYVGPLKDGTYIKTVFKSAHVAQTPVTQVWAGHSACFAISVTKEQRKQLNRCRGIVALPSPSPLARSFIADIFFLKGDSVTINTGTFQATAHILHLKRTVRIVHAQAINDRGTISADSKVTLRSGSCARVTFAFTPSGSQYIRKGMRVILRDGGIRGIGIVKEMIN